MISNAALSEIFDIVDPQIDDHQQPPKCTSSNTLKNAEHFIGANASKELTEQRIVKNFDVSFGTSRLINMTV